MKLIKKNLKWITLSIVMLVIIGGIIIKYSIINKEVEQISIDELELEINQTNDLPETNDETNETGESEPALIYVDVKGAIQNPGVYEVAEGKKVIDVINLAGGFTEEADTSMINLAKKVSDEMVIIIYTASEVKNTTETETIVKVIEKECICPEITNDACINQSENKTSEEATTDKKVNINTALLEELLTLTGIGESKAEAIIAYREENGKFEKTEDLMNVSGIGESLYEKIKDNITV